MNRVENEESKLRHLSTETLYDLLEQELTTGKIDYPEDSIMDDETKFPAYCVEIYKSAKKMTGKEVFNLFEEYGVLDYVIGCYGALHTTGAQYTDRGYRRVYRFAENRLTHLRLDHINS